MALSFAAGTASANRGLEVGSPGNITGTSRVTFEEAGGGGIACNVTRVITLHRSIPKVLKTLIGYVREVRIGRPEECTARFPVTRILRIVILELPWHLTYEGFGGTLPRITEIRILVVRPGIRIEFRDFLGGTWLCLYQPANQKTIARLDATQRATEIRIEPELLPGSVEPGGKTCPEGSFSGTLRLSPQVTVRLI